MIYEWLVNFLCELASVLWLYRCGGSRPRPFPLPGRVTVFSLNRFRF